MRKLMSKKGFTLVELMIVVVIMGILVAVAVPVYGAVTKNAEKKTCKSNQRIIVENLNQYQMTGGADGDQIAWATLAETFTGTGTLTATTDANFTKLFNKGIPTCPTAGAGYTVKVEENGTSGTITVACADAKASDLGHN